MTSSIVLLLFLCTSAVSGEAVGVITSVDGSVNLQRGETTTAIELPDMLILIGDTLEVGQEGSCSVLLATGESFRLTANALFIVEKPESNRLIDRVARFFAQLKDDFSGRPHSTVMLTRNASALLYEPLDAVQLVFPVDNGAVRSSNPAFAWRAVPKLEQVQILVIAEDRGPQTQQVGSHQNTLLWPGLSSGAKHTWQVRALLNGFPVESRYQSFEVIGEQEEQLIDQALESLDSLESGILLFAAGLHADALAYFESAAENPATREQGQLWLTRLLDRCGILSVAGGGSPR